MAQSWVKEHETVEVRVVWVEMLRFVQSVVVFDISRDLEFVLDQLEHGAKGIARCSLGEWVFGVAVVHGFRADEDEVEICAGEKPD